MFFNVTIGTSDASAGPNGGRVRQRRERVQVAADDQDRHAGLHRAARGGGRRTTASRRQMSYGCEKSLMVSHSTAAKGLNASGAPAKDSQPRVVQAGHGQVGPAREAASGLRGRVVPRGPTGLASRSSGTSSLAKRGAHAEASQLRAASPGPTRCPGPCRRARAGRRARCRMLVSASRAAGDRRRPHPLQQRAQIAPPSPARPSPERPAPPRPRTRTRGRDRAAGTPSPAPTECSVDGWRAM